MKDAHEIMMAANPRCSDRPDFFSGRGPRTSDLNGELLSRIHAQVVHDNGAKAGEAFVAMVADLPSASMTNFLLNLRALSDRGWEHDPRDLDAREESMDDARSDAERGAIGFVAVAHALAGVRRKPGGADSSDDMAVRGGFLRAHRYVLEKGAWRKLKKGETPPVQRSIYGW